MAFNYDENIQNILLSMSLSPYLPTGSSVGYGFQMAYSGSATGSLTGAITIYDDNILSTGTASLQLFIPSSFYLDSGFTSQSISRLVTQYTDFPTGKADETISTQVIYAPGEITPLACDTSCYQGENYYWVFDPNAPTLNSPQNYANLANRQTVRGLKGGVSITSTSHSSPFVNAGSVGTMGLVCQDSASGAIVGLTNNHVVIRDAFYTSQRTYTNPQNEYNLNDSSNTIQGDFIYQNGESTSQPVVPGGANEIGRVMRYVPIYTSASIVANPSLVNKVDAAMFSLYCTSSTGATIINFASSFQQLGLSNTSAMPFATTAEINNLLNTNPELYSSGRTTGPKGSPDTLCPLRMVGYASFPIKYPLQGTQTLSYFTDVIKFVKPANSSSFNPSTTSIVTTCPFPVWGGDSGSTLIAKISGVWKIIGLVFAGNGTPYNPQTGVPNVTINGVVNPLQVASSIGYACRIDQVASQLGIKAWTGSAAPVVDHSTIVYKTVSGSSSTSTLVCSGSTYWQVGLTEKHNIC
jgi:hypothetical protein